VSGAEVSKAYFLDSSALVKRYVQLAAALKIRHERQNAGLAPPTLISADQALNDAAIEEGLTVDDPLLHL
jgi:hypothetical protein